MPLFGRLVGDVNAKRWSENAPRIDFSPLGAAVMHEELKKISQFYPMVEVWRVSIMPDHIHLIVSVKEDMGEGKHLGVVVKGFKTGCSRAWWRLQDEGKMSREYSKGKTFEPETGKEKGGRPANELPVGKCESCRTGSSSSVSPEDKKRPVLFEPGYNDRILCEEGQLKRWKNYLDDNPRRLMLKRANPQYFTILHDMDLAGRKCQIVGNRFLLDIPDKVAVIVHRRYTDEENERLRKQWLECGERGGVLVSAAISQKEKDVLREAMNRHYNIILLRENGFPELYKPMGESFDACSEGRLLQISPWEYHKAKKTITRAQCLELNSIAESIVEM